MSLLTQAEGGSESSDSWVQLPISQARGSGASTPGVGSDLPAPTTNTFSGWGDSLTSAMTPWSQSIKNSGTKSMIGVFSSVGYFQAHVQL